MGDDQLEEEAAEAFRRELGSYRHVHEELMQRLREELGREMHLPPNDGTIVDMAESLCERWQHEPESRKGQNMPKVRELVEAQFKVVRMMLKCEDTYLRGRGEDTEH